MPTPTSSKESSPPPRPINRAERRRAIKVPPPPGPTVSVGDIMEDLLLFLTKAQVFGQEATLIRQKLMARIGASTDTPEGKG